MNGEIKVDFVDMEKKLNLYVDRGWVTGVVEARKEPITVTKPDASLIKRAERVAHSGKDRTTARGRGQRGFRTILCL